jgi:hypothetical protein
MVGTGELGAESCVVMVLKAGRPLHPFGKCRDR